MVCKDSLEITIAGITLLFTALGYFLSRRMFCRGRREAKQAKICIRYEKFALGKGRFVIENVGKADCHNLIVHFIDKGDGFFHLKSDYHYELISAGMTVVIETTVGTHLPNVVNATVTWKDDYKKKNSGKIPISISQ